MTTISLGTQSVNTNGVLPSIGSPAPDFSLVLSDLSEITTQDLAGKRVVLNVFPSIDTEICAMSTRFFNQAATDLANTVVLCVSKDLPFALARFCAAEGLDKVSVASAFRSSFAQDFGLEMVDGPLATLCSRAIIILDENANVVYTQQVPQIKQEPDYQQALAALS